jgi:iron complex transport system ATP-binding protein
MSILSTHNLTVGYRKGNTDTPILSSLNLSVEQGKLVALLGANGIGKSTLLRTITGDQAPLEGDG